ncbi:hypothetical protein MTR67_035269 [Solanum verrucosum]|uniref:Transposase n=1 Tax=Solanum verrucosum TaxID=315347 RepID=A0AAF0ZM58_SOLVR|nr:hypothetical protein MTR67_035269 [Solanum verrucosum]
MIEPDGSSWHPAKDAAQALKDCVRRLYTQAYHSWSEIPNRIRQAMFNEFQKVWDTNQRSGWMLPHVFDDLRLYWNTDKFKAMSEQAKKARGSLKGGSLHTVGAEIVGTITRETEKELGCTPIEPEVFKKTHVKKKENELDLDVWVEERAKRTFSGVEGIGSSSQAEALDGVQIVAMSAHIAQLISALAESERRRVAEQQSMSATVQEIKEQVLNLAHQPTTSSPTKDTDNNSEKDDDFVDRTP